MVDPELVKEWLSKADEDFSFASLTLRKIDAYFGLVAFHFHQAAEKFLKAYIVAHELEFSKIHNLLRLIEICAGQDPGFLELKLSATYLNRYYIEARYPMVNHYPSISREETNRAMEEAAKIADFVRKKLKIYG